jgi:hypothetical protein
VQFVGGSAEDALAATRAMRRITLGANSGFTIPPRLRRHSDRHRPAPRGGEDTPPQINTGIAHTGARRRAGGAGLVNPPWEAFHAALEAFAEHVRAAAPPPGA